MRSKGMILNLVISACLTVSLSYVYSIWIFNLVHYTSQVSAACILVAVLYPICLRLMRSEIGYLREVLILLLILAVSLGVSEVIYYSKMEAIHHDFGESFAVLVFYLVGLECVAICSYTLTYLVCRLLFRRQSGNLWAKAKAKSDFA